MNSSVAPGATVVRSLGLGLAVLSFGAYFCATAVGDLFPLEHFGAVFAIGETAGRVTSVLEDSPAGRVGIRPDDHILTIEGRPVRNTLDWAAVYARITEGQPIETTILRDKVPLHLEVRFQRRADGPFATAERRVVILSRAAQLVTLVFAVIILLKARGPEALLGFWLLATIGIYSVGLPPRMAAVWRQFPALLQVLFYVPSLSKVIVGIILLAFFRALLRRPLLDRAGAVLVLVALACTAWELPFITALVYRPAWLPLLTGFLPLIVGVNLVCLGVALVLLLRHYRGLADPHDRRKLRWILAGSALGLSMGAPTVAGLWLGVNDPTLIYDNPPGVQVAYTTFLIMPVSFWWAIASRRLFDIQFVVRRGIQYLFARGALIVATPATIGGFAAEGVLHRNDSLLDLVQRHGFLYACVAVGLVLFRRRRERWLDAIDRRLFRERYDSAQLLRDLVSELRTTSEFAPAAHVAVRQVGAALHPEWLTVFAGSGDDDLRAIAGLVSDQAWPRGCAILASVRSRGVPLDVHRHSRAWTAMDDEDRQRVRAANVHLMVPIVTRFAGTEAVMMLGPKRSGEPYAREDRTLLQAVGASLGALTQAAPAEDHVSSARPVRADPAWEARLWQLADAVASGDAVDWSRESEQASSDDRRHMLLELQALERLMDAHGAREAIRLLAPGEVAGVAPPKGRWGRFELRDQLGRGRFGSVYRAWDPTLEREVAIKLLDDEQIDRTAYLREARLLARVRHPNVVHVYGADVQEGLPGFWMELLDGQTLAAMVTERGPMSTSDTLMVADAVCLALTSVHRAGLVHQDVKAENVVRERDGRLVLMDLGAGVSDASRPRWGTPRYMAPELFRNGNASVQSDIYSLGVLLFFVATGAFPCDGSNREIAREHEAGRQRRLEDLRPGLPESFRRGVARALSAEPAGRFSSSDELRGVLRGEAQ